MSNTSHYRDFLRSFRQPVDYLPRIRQLKQSLVDGNLTPTHEIVRELETVAIKQRIHLKRGIFAVCFESFDVRAG